MEHAKALIDLDYFQKLKKHLRSIKIPPLSDSESFGIDGTSFQITIGRPFHWVRFRWWEEGPEEWKDLISLTHEMIDQFEEILENSK